MTLTEIKNALATISNTLNAITVQGKDNMNHLLGSILLLDKIVVNIEEQEKKEATDNAEHQTD